MKAPESILSVWHEFDAFPMETLTKAWFLKHLPRVRQRTIEEMEKHRRVTGASGNCFDLAIWLQHEFQKAQIQSYAVGDESDGKPGHVGIIALDPKGRRYLCDLGDLWIQPLLIDVESTTEKGQSHTGFFAGASIETELNGDELAIKFHRPGGKVSRQPYDLTWLALELRLQDLDSSLVRN